MMEKVLIVLRKVDAVCFDVDSTVIQEEGIDELAKFSGKADQVTKLTTQAMSGNMQFQESLKIRLDIIQPNLQTVQDFIRTKPATLSSGIKNLINLLHSRHIPVYLISGGFKCIITPIADQLRIPHENIYTNRLKFYFNGDYAGFDENQPTSRSGGKGMVVQHLKDTFDYKNLISIGDGVTDLETCPPADAFIGYGGNVIRPTVKAKSSWFITDFNEIINILSNNKN